MVSILCTQYACVSADATVDGRVLGQASVMLMNGEHIPGSIYTPNDRESVVLGYINSGTFVPSVSEHTKYIAKLSEGQGNIVYSALRGRDGTYLSPGMIAQNGANTAEQCALLNCL